MVCHDASPTLAWSFRPMLCPTYAADIFFAQTWKDFRLRLPENMTSEYRLLDLDWLKHMWRPDSFFKNAKSVTFQTMTIPNHYVWLYKDKTILYMVKLTLKLSKFHVSGGYLQAEATTGLPSLQHLHTDLSHRHHVGKYSLVIFKLKRRLCYHLFNTYIPTCLIVIMSLKRRLGYHLFNTYIPTCLIVIMSHAKSQAQLPPVSYLKAVDAFMSVCTVFVFMALMEYCLVNIVLGDGRKQKNPEETARDKIRALNIDRFSRVFFPLLFSVLNATYWIQFAQYI
ncbi:Histamine-gated chloride channel [Operophtera brumata]|uniref:Histamine-gated chloride channel n=1 Tax=Operophtera brumata TaxID=104452 RepID=A0A0L7LSL1_OPEBR|nr:Histamine-gated chloride channel [Operophtera brumata]